MKTILFFITLSFTWDPPVDGPQIDGYKLYWGNKAGERIEGAFLDVGNRNTATLNFEDGKPYFFVVRSYNQWGESEDSNEISAGKPVAVKGFRITK